MQSQPSLSQCNQNVNFHCRMKKSLSRPLLSHLPRCLDFCHSRLITLHVLLATLAALRTSFYPILAIIVPTISILGALAMGRLSGIAVNAVTAHIPAGCQLALVVTLPAVIVMSSRHKTFGAAIDHVCVTRLMFQRPVLFDLVSAHTGNQPFLVCTSIQAMYQCTLWAGEITRGFCNLRSFIFTSLCTV
jgi:hypothetical protein